MNKLKDETATAQPENLAFENREYRGFKVRGVYINDGSGNGRIEFWRNGEITGSFFCMAYKIFNYSAHGNELIDNHLDSPPVAPSEPAPTIAESDLQRTISAGFRTYITITAADTAEGERVVKGWPDDKVREFARNWVARAEARQRLADEAITELRRMKGLAPHEL